MRAAHGRPEDGFSLIEVLIALAVMGIGMVAILTSIGTAVVGSATHRKQSDGLTEVITAAETVLNARTTPYDSCMAKGTYQTALNALPLPAGWTAPALAVMSVEYWDGTTFQATCHDTDPADSAHFLRMQRLTLTVTSPGASDVETIEIVKRYPS